MRALTLAIACVIAAVPLTAQAPDGNAVLRGAGVTVPRGGAEAAFDAGLTGPLPVPPGAFATLLVGMGPFGSATRAKNAYAFGVLAGRSGRNVPPAQLAGAGVALLQMLVSDDRRSRVAGARVAGLVFAAPLDGQPPPSRPSGLIEGLILLLNEPNEDERAAAMEAIGLMRETAAVPSLTDLYERYRAGNNRRMAGAAVEALARIGDPLSAPLVAGLASDSWGDRNDAAGLAVAFARERYLKDGSVARLRDAARHRSLGPRARVYLAELGLPVP